MIFPQFAAGAARYGIAAASRAACLYGVPLATCLQWVRQFGRSGYIV